ncbi:uncharacterized protein MONBRDRAFT_24765 [Monosiga brevicollis MX1]|uniref:Secreted protein n=1 Tax=Monosiga brevicollis TaxID=81824 RepID=A9UXE8_MONBE|nr:uncharacterized protein MONBRDRAFT_24765 [Monosiga brevicollis MX1]EDQ90204.1 predicted protein [Monosiga brevicollis MX1]|eukprot:XP_001744971.1 hypothetical protein [Monosiga brevicollis MX1]
MAYLCALLLHLRLICDGLLWQAGARPLDLLLRNIRINLERQACLPINLFHFIARRRAIVRNPCPLLLPNFESQCVGWRVDPQLFNIHDLQTLCDYQAAQTATAQAAPTN